MIITVNKKIDIDKLIDMAFTKGIIISTDLHIEYDDYKKNGVNINIRKYETEIIKIYAQLI